LIHLIERLLTQLVTHLGKTKITIYPTSYMDWRPRPVSKINVYMRSCSR